MKIYFPVIFLCSLFSTSVLSQTIPELKQQLEKCKDLQKCSKIESDIGRLYFAESDFVNAQKYFFSSLKNAEKANDQHLIATANNNISATYMETENDSIAIEYAKKAVEIQQRLKDHKGLADAYNSLANIYYVQEKDDLSLHYFSESIKEREIIKDSAGLYAGYKNLGANYFETGELEKAKENFEKSIRYISDKADSTKWLGAYLTLAQTNLQTKDYARTKFYLDLCTPYIHRSKVYNKVSDYYYISSGYHEKTGKAFEALEDFKQYAKFRDSVISTDKNVQLSELNVKYESEKKENLINQQQFEIKQKNNILIFSTILFVTLLLAAYFIYKNHRNKQEKKLQNEIFRQREFAARSLFEGEQNERIRIARDLHDSVGQMLSLAKMNMSATPFTQSQLQQSIQLIDDTIGEVRNISHNLIPEDLSFGLYAALETMADKINNAGNTHMEVDISGQVRQHVLKKENELSIYRIIQEVVSNMIRHAQASNIILTITEDAGTLLLSIRDNGKGLEAGSIENSKGIGWKNIKARVNLMDGQLKIQSEKIQGTHIEIALPVKQ